MYPNFQQENDQFMCKKSNHNSPITMIALDNQIPLVDRLLCTKCFTEKQTVTNKTLSIEQALINKTEKEIMINVNRDEKIKKTQLGLEELDVQVKNLIDELIQQYKKLQDVSLLWQNDIRELGERKIELSFNQYLESQNPNYKANSDVFEINESYFQKIEKILFEISKPEANKNCYDLLKNIQNDNVEKINLRIENQRAQNIRQIVPPKLSNKAEIQLINKLENKYEQKALAFNKFGSIMVSGCDQKIIVWQSDQKNLIKKAELYGHKKQIFCLAYSKKINWFASGSADRSIRCWKEWESIENELNHEHLDSVYCLILNKNEDKLLSCSRDKSIKVWKVQPEFNVFQFDYDLEVRHQNIINCISFNESETALVSCGDDNQIIVWVKDNQKWIYSTHIILEDSGNRICFINDQIVWQQCKKGILHLLAFKNKELRRRQNIKLSDAERDGQCLFPTIYNRQKSIILTKYNQWIYILKLREDGEIQLLSSVDCKSQYNYGALTEDGEKLIIWTKFGEEFRIYNIIYE